jgi:hypothetical protein
MTCSKEHINYAAASHADARSKTSSKCKREIQVSQQLLPLAFDACSEKDRQANDLLTRAINSRNDHCFIYRTTMKQRYYLQTPFDGFTISAGRTLAGCSHVPHD